MSESRYYATGKRKRAVARCWLTPGEGKIQVNKRAIEDYFTRAMRHGVARALLEYNPEFRQLLKKAGFLTRDARKKERKKYGKKGARASFQFSKR